MKTKMTTSEFAGLHEVNKRTLHYYDSIGLFSPKEKGNNGYRYYDAAQSMDFEYLRMLKALNMSIEEILQYAENPNTKDFLSIADKKLKEINEEIFRLERTRQILETKKEQAEICQNLTSDHITVIECPEEKYLTIPFSFEEDDMSLVFSSAKNAWGIEQCRMGIGSFLSLDKIKKEDFRIYDGLFTPAMNHAPSDHLHIKPAGKYLCGYQRGTWEKLPGLYRKMLSYASCHHLTLTGYAYEMGMNGFIISHKNDYITRIVMSISP